MGKMRNWEYLSSRQWRLQNCIEHLAQDRLT